jgi:hypothetical protein
MLTFENESQNDKRGENSPCEKKLKKRYANGMSFIFLHMRWGGGGERAKDRRQKKRVSDEPWGIS